MSALTRPQFERIAKRHAESIIEDVERELGYEIGLEDWEACLDFVYEELVSLLSHAWPGPDEEPQ